MSVSNNFFAFLHSPCHSRMTFSLPSHLTSPPPTHHHFSSQHLSKFSFRHRLASPSTQFRPAGTHSSTSYGPPLPLATLVLCSTYRPRCLATRVAYSMVSVRRLLAGMHCALCMLIYVLCSSVSYALSPQSNLYNPDLPTHAQGDANGACRATAVCPIYACPRCSPSIFCSS